jgi:hypothetical protein
MITLYVAANSDPEVADQIMRDMQRIESELPRESRVDKSRGYELSDTRNRHRCFFPYQEQRQLPKAESPIAAAFF